jgi:hypothetical protein
MSPEIEALYGEIGNATADLVPDDFSQAWVFTEIFDGVYSVAVFFEAGDRSLHCLYDGLIEVKRLILELHKAFEDQKETPFTVATFWVNSQGKFRLDVGYEDVSDLGLQDNRQVKWIEKYLGPNASIGYGA